jgi:hypothetical protein
VIYILSIFTTIHISVGPLVLFCRYHHPHSYKWSYLLISLLIFLILLDNFTRIRFLTLPYHGTFAHLLNLLTLDIFGLYSHTLLHLLLQRDSTARWDGRSRDWFFIDLIQNKIVLLHILLLIERTMRHILGNSVDKLRPEINLEGRLQKQRHVVK